MSLLDLSSYEDYGMPEYIKAINAAKLLFKQQKQDQLISYALLSSLDGGTAHDIAKNGSVLKEDFV
jgi:hypothetical protein